MVTALVAGVPALTPEGRLEPKESLTDSPSSSTVSWAAVKVKDLEVSPASKVTFSRHAGVVGGGGAALVGLPLWG